MSTTSLILSAPQVRAALAGVLRQVWVPIPKAVDVAGQPANAMYPARDGNPVFWWGKTGANMPEFILRQYTTGMRCPFAVGARLIVRETFRAFDDGDIFYKADWWKNGRYHIPVHSDDEPDDWRWQPASQMPLAFSRLTLPAVAGVEVRRIGQAREHTQTVFDMGYTMDSYAKPGHGGWEALADCESALRDDWNKRYGKRYEWIDDDDSPYCWALTFDVPTDDRERGMR